MAAPKTGHQCKLYRNTGTDAAPTLVELTGVTDVSLNQNGIVTPEFQVRGENDTLVLPSIGDVVTLSFKYTPGYNQTVFNSLITDFLNKTPRQYAITSGIFSSADEFGWVIPFLIENAPWDQQLLQVTGAEFELKGIAYMEESGSILGKQWFDSILDWGAGT